MTITTVDIFLINIFTYVFLSIYVSIYLYVNKLNLNNESNEEIAQGVTSLDITLQSCSSLLATSQKRAAPEGRADKL